MNWYGMPVFSRLSIIGSFLALAGYLVYRTGEKAQVGGGAAVLVLVGFTVAFSVGLAWTIFPDFCNSIFRREDE